MALPLFIPTETVRAELVARIEQATGRSARIDGPISIGILPTVRVSAGGIGLAGVTGDTEAFSVDSVSFGVGLLPLLSGRVAINTITIVRPRLLYEIDADGRSNWSAAGEASGPAAAGAPPKSMEDLIAAAPDAAPAAAIADDTLAALDRINIGRLIVSDGTFVYRDRRTGSEETVEAVNVSVAAPDPRAGAKIDGRFTWQGIEEKFTLTSGAWPDRTRLAALPFTLTVSDKLASLSANGTALDGDTVFAGALEMSGGSLADLAARFGSSLPAAPAYGKYSATATVAASGTQIAVNTFSATLGDAAFQGQAVIATDRPRPGIGLRLAAGAIDTADFIAPGAAAASGSGGGGGAAEQPIDLSVLGAVDANVDFTADSIRVGSVALEKLGLDLKLVNRTLQATIREVLVDGAPGSGSLTANANGAVPEIAGALKMAGLDVGAVLNLAGVAAPVTGKGGVDVTFKTTGTTRTALADNLDAKGRISLADGQVTGLNLAASVGGDKSADQIDDIDMTASFESLTSPIAATGALTWRKVRFDVSGKADVRALLAGKTTNVALKASSKTVDLGFTGKAGMTGLGEGEVSLATPSLRNLLAWLGRPIGGGGGLQAFSIKGAVALGTDTFSFDRATFTLDRSSGLGTGQVTFGARPAVSAGLSMKVLDVTPYLAASGASGGGAGGGGGAGWSDEPIAFDGLRSIDANLNLKAEQILADKLKIGATAMTVTLAGGKLAANLTDMNLYSGKGAGSLTVDGSGSTPAAAGSFQLSGLSALPFLSDAIGFTRVEGTGAFSFDLTTSGRSQAALVRALQGTGAMEFRDGAIRGFNLASLRGLSLESVLGGQLGTADRTDFSRLAGTYTVGQGVLTNQDLVLIGPLIRATGAGTVDLGQRTIAYRLEPKIVGTLQGQGGGTDAEGLTLPFRIEGSWDAPRFVPEFDAILADPNRAVDQLKNVGGGLLNSIFGGNAATSGQAGQQPPAAQAPAAEATPPATQAPDAEQPPAEPASEAQEGEAPATEAPPAEAQSEAQPEEQPAEPAPQPGNPLELLLPKLFPQTGQ